MLCTLCTDKCETVNIQNQPKPTFTLANPRLLFQAAPKTALPNRFLAFQKGKISRHGGKIEDDEEGVVI